MIALTRKVFLSKFILMSNEKWFKLRKNIKAMSIYLHFRDTRLTAYNEGQKENSLIIMKFCLLSLLKFSISLKYYCSLLQYSITIFFVYFTKKENQITLVDSRKIYYCNNKISCIKLNYIMTGFGVRNFKLFFFKKENKKI